MTLFWEREARLINASALPYSKMIPGVRRNPDERSQSLEFQSKHNLEAGKAANHSEEPKFEEDVEPGSKPHGLADIRISQCFSILGKK